MKFPAAETPATATERIIFSSKEDVHKKDPSEIKFTWNAYNLTSNTAAGVQISIWGYRETKTTPEFEYITTLEVVDDEMHDDTRYKGTR